MKKIAVITSGGDCQGMNQVLYSLAQFCQKKNITLIGFYRGYQGIIDNQFTTLNSQILQSVAHLGGTILKSSRCQAMLSPAGRQQAVNNLQAQEIDGLIVIGGDGSAQGANLLSQEFNFPTVVIPATIDNDIDQVALSLGYLSAIDRAVTQLSWIEDTARSHERIFIVEVMGRHSGNLAKGISEQLQPLATILPQTEITDELITQIKQNYQKQTSSLILITELQPNKVKLLTDKLTGFKEIRINTLGHGQRGGPPTKAEIRLATQMARQGLKNLLHHQWGMVILKPKD